VTGVDQSVGRSIALLFATAGATIAANARRPAECASVVESIRAVGGRAVAVPGSVGSIDECAALAAAVTMHFDRVDILVNCAVNPRYETTTDAAEESIARIWEFSVLGPLRLAGYAADSWMQSTGGSIVNVAWLPDPETDALSNAHRASQAALISVTRTLARQLAPVGIRVNAIATLLGEQNVGHVLIDSSRAPDHPDGEVAPRRIADPDDVAWSALYLASDLSAAVSGTVLIADGGLGEW
jgi:dehydrogenase/reductase SDR family member 4